MRGKNRVAWKVGFWTIISRDNYHVMVAMETTLMAVHQRRIFFEQSQTHGT